MTSRTAGLGQENTDRRYERLKLSPFLQTAYVIVELFNSELNAFPFSS